MASPSLPALHPPQESACQIEQQIHLLDAIAKRLIAEHAALAQQIGRLEQLGTYPKASLYYHGGKYLYLIFPMVNRKRQRVYIGSDRAKVAQAEAAVARGKLYLVLEKQLRQVDHQLANLAESLGSFIVKNKEAS